MRGSVLSQTADLKSSYEQALAGLRIALQQKQAQMSALSAEIRELNSGIVAISRQLTPQGFVGPLFPLHQNSPKYANISLRWAILDVLYESAPMSTAELAEALKEAGVQTRAANFANNVSAILSVNVKEKSEVQQLPSGKWQLTDKGRSAIEHIRTTPRFRQRVP
jgi:hypothetical protein